MSSGTLNNKRRSAGEDQQFASMTYVLEGAGTAWLKGDAPLPSPDPWDLHCTRYAPVPSAAGVQGLFLRLRLLAGSTRGVAGSNLFPGPAAGN